jgi:hypothetical protein
MSRSSTQLEQARQIKRLTGSGGQSEAPLPKGPNRKERELLECWDLMEARVRRLPESLQWQRITIERGDRGINVRVTV